MTSSLLTWMIFAPLVGGVLSLIVRETWVRWVALPCAAAVFLLSLWGFSLYSQDVAPGLREAWEADGGLLDQALEREGIHDVVVRERFRAALLRRAPEGDGLRALADDLAGVDLAEANLRAVRAAGPDPERLSDADRLLVDAAREAGALAHTLGVLERELSGLRRASAGPFQGQFKLAQHVSWIPGLGVQYFVAVDGLSISLVLLTALITLLCLVYASSRSEGEARLRRACALLLLAEGALLGVLCSLDLVLLFTFWALVLVPCFFLIGGEEGSPRARAGARFLLPGFLGALALLAAALLLGLRAGEGNFNVLALAELAREGVIPRWLQEVAFGLLFLSCAVRLPLVPLHGWLPAAQRHLPAEFAAFIQGAFLASGAYGLIRLAWPLCPEVVTRPEVVTAVGVLALVNLAGGTVLALGARDLRRLLAYLSVAHVGYVLLGLCALTPGGAAGAALELVAHGAACGGACLAVGVVIDRTRDGDVGALGGLIGPLPSLTALTAVLLLTLAGAPALAGFAPRLLIFLGAAQSDLLPGWIVVAAAGGLVLSAGAVLWTLNRVFLGELHRTELASAADVRVGEAVALVPLAGVCLLLGLLPRLALDALGPSLEALLSLLGRGP